MKKTLLILFLVLFSINIFSCTSIKSNNINNIEQESFYNYKKFTDELQEMTYIMQDEKLMEEIESNINTKILDFKQNETNTVTAYTIFPKYEISPSRTAYGYSQYLEKNINGYLSEYMYENVQVKKDNLEDYFKDNKEFKNLTEISLNLLCDERTIDLSKNEIEKLFFENGFRCYINENKFYDGTIIRIYSISENYNINYIENSDINIIQTFNNKDGLLSVQNITIDAPVKIRDTFLINGDLNKPNRLILFVSNLNDIDGIENTGVRTELYFLEFGKEKFEGLIYFEWQPRPIKLKQTIYSIDYFGDISNEEFDIQYFFDGVSIGINKGIIFDTLQEIEKDNSFFLTSNRMISEKPEYYELDIINGFEVPFFIKYEVLN